MLTRALGALTGGAAALQDGLRPRVHALYTRWALREYVRGGSRPWSRGYKQFRARFIAETLASPGAMRRFAAGEPPAPGHGRGLDERVVEYPWAFSRLPVREGALLDAGSVLNHEYLLDRPELSRQHITIVTLAPEATAFWQKGISYVYADLRHLPFDDGFFDTIVCLSTLEHVGMDNALYTAFAEAERLPRAAGDALTAVRELRRVLARGGRALISVPFGRPDNLGWMQVFDSSRSDALLEAFGPTRAGATYFRYTRQGWTVSDASGCADALYHDVHSGANAGDDGAAAARAVLCLDLAG